MIPPLSQSWGTAPCSGPNPSSWSSAPCSGAQPLVLGLSSLLWGVPAVLCSSNRVQGGLRGAILGHAALGVPFQSLGSPMPDPWISSCQAGWKHGPAKLFSLGPSLQPGVALSCSIPTIPRTVPHLCSGALGTLRTRTATLSRTVAQIPHPTGLTELLR